MNRRLFFALLTALVLYPRRLAAVLGRESTGVARIPRFNADFLPCTASGEKILLGVWFGGRYVPLPRLHFDRLRATFYPPMDVWVVTYLRGQVTGAGLIPDEAEIPPLARSSRQGT